MLRKLYITAIVITVLPTLLLAAGKIRGRVIDRQTREPLVGANVLVVETTLGASVNVEGEYIVLNIPAGVYSLKATFVGYQAVTVNNIRVNNDLTTTLDFELPQEAVALQAIEITAERPLVNKSATNAVRITTTEDLDAIPVRGMNNILSLTPGVVLQDNTVFIRGGRLDEVGYYLEGMAIRNAMVGGRAVTIVQDAVEEVQVQAGGYNAEFGWANAGIVQTQLKSGTSDLKASMQFITDNITASSKSSAFDGSKRLGAYWFGYNEFTASLSGPVLSDRVKLFGLFNYLYQRDQAPQPYPGIDLGTIVGQTGDTLTLTYPAGPLLKNAREDYTGTGTLTIDLSPVNLRVAGSYTWSRFDNPYNTHRNKGSVANILNLNRIEQADQNNGSISLKFTHLLGAATYYELTGGYFLQSQKNYDPILGDNFLAYGDSVANAEAGVIWSRSAADVASGQLGRFIRPTRKFLYDFSFNGEGDVLAGYQTFKRETVSLVGALVTQIGSEHSLKVGGELQSYTMRGYSWGNETVVSLAGLLSANQALPDGHPHKIPDEQVLVNAGVNNFGYDVWGRESNESGYMGPRRPVFAAAYIQDKIEYKDLVINAGLRYDYIDVDNYRLQDPTRPELSIDYYSGAIDPGGMVPVDAFQAISPRVGLSFPVTDQTVFHTQFGQFVQQSRLRDIYQGSYLTAANLRGGFFIHTPVGFDVRPTRSTQYEIGFTQQVGDVMSIDITGYYKDIKDQVVYEQVNTASGSPFGAYFTFANGDYATTKGVELNFIMRRYQRIQMNAALTFQDAQGTGSYPNSNRGIVGAPLDGVTIFTPKYVTPLEYNNAIRGSVNVDYRFGAGDGGPVLQRSGISLLMVFNSGHPYTRGVGGVDLEGEARSRQPVEPLNASTTPWTFQVDLRIDKTFRLFNTVDLNVGLYVINLFDSKNEQNVFLRTGTTTDDGVLSSPSMGTPLLQTYGPGYANVYRAINIDYYEQYQSAVGLNTVPYFYGPPRQIRLGFRLDY